MISNKSIKICLVLALTSIIFTANNAVAADFAIMLKTGGVRLSDETQYLDGETRTFDEDSEKTLAIAWEIRNSRNVGIGMEYITFEHDFTAPVYSGYTKTELYMFSARKYFAADSMIHPFGGIGLGWGYTKFDRTVDVDRDWNYVLQLSAGLELRFAEEFGLYIEAKSLMSGTDGVRENEYDFSGPSLMTGVSFIF
jgi:opacity protein-like surface antigen